MDPEYSEGTWGETNASHFQPLCEELQKLHEEPQTSDLGYCVMMTVIRELGLLYVLGLTCTNLLFVTILF